MVLYLRNLCLTEKISANLYSPNHDKRQDVVRHFGEKLNNYKNYYVYILTESKVRLFTLILSFLFNSCVGQISESIQVKITKIHKDSITLKAESQPE
jgi:hypothetical protein